jgi:hypothetical protein
MHRWTAAGVLALVGAAAMAVQAQQPARTDAQTPARTFRQLEALTPRVVEQLEVQRQNVEEILASPELRRSVAGQRPAVDAAATAQAAGARQGAAVPQVTIDLDALRGRVGPVRDVQITQEGKAVASAPVDRAVTIRHGELLAVRRPPVRPDPGTTPAPAPVLTPGDPVGPGQPDTDDGAVSPTILYTVDRGGRLRELALVHRSAGLHWQPERERFAGELLVGLLDREDPRAAGPLGTSIPIQLVAAPGSIAANEQDLAVDTIGVPLKRVHVEVAAPDDPFQIRFVSSIDEDLPPAALPVVRPRLLLSVPDTLPGLGVGEAEVTVSALDTVLRPGQAITLALDNGWLAQPVVVVAETGTASTRIRSDWLGSGTLRIAAPAVYAADPKTITYSVPVQFIVATLLGAMLGAYVLVYRMKRTDPAGQRSYSTDWLAGVAVGAAATTMAYAGMKLPEWIPLPTALTGEAAPFALAFICAAAGTSLIHAFTGPGQKAPVET